MRKNNMEEARKKCGFTREDVASRIGVSSISVRNWELGLVEPGAYKAMEMADLYGVSIGYLLGKEEEKNA